MNKNQLEKYPASNLGEKHLSVTSYNIHRCIGWDRKQDPERVAQVLRQTGSTIIGLQEVESLAASGSQAAYLAGATGLTPVAGPAFKHRTGYYGNLLLTRYPVLNNRCLDISVRGWEPRCTIDATLDVEGLPVRTIVTHLGLKPVERRRQIKLLLEIFKTAAEKLILVMGDINEWAPFSPRIRSLNGSLGKSPGMRTFPSLLPIAALDRIWVRPGNAMRSIQVHKSRLALIASDHLPIMADIVVHSGAANGEGLL